jgi:hypothetical protein
LLLLLVVLLLLILPAPLIVSPHTANQPATDSADRRALAGIAGDGADTQTEQAAAHRATTDATLLGFLLGRRRTAGDLRVRRVETALLHRPHVAAAMILILLFLRLTLRRVNKSVLSANIRNASDQPGKRQNANPATCGHQP